MEKKGESGSTKATVKSVFVQGSGWMAKRFDSWKGQEQEEQHISGQVWRSTKEQADQDVEKMVSDMQKMGWKF